MKVKIECRTSTCSAKGSSADYYMVFTKNGVYNTTSSVCRFCRREMHVVEKIKTT